jgi:hypothetical protein
MPPISSHDIRASGDSLSDELYISFVDGLLVDAKSVFLSAVAVTVIEIVGSIAAVSAALAALSVSQLLVAAGRLYFMGVHARQLPSRTVAIARRQERRFAIGAISSLAALSLWTLGTFFIKPVGFPTLLGATMTIAYAFGMQTRGFAIYRGISANLFAAYVPLSIGLIVAGGWYPAGPAPISSRCWRPTRSRRCSPSVSTWRSTICRTGC